MVRETLEKSGNIMNIFESQGILCIFSHLRQVNFKIFSNRGGQFKCISSHFRQVNFKIFSNHGGQFKCISGLLPKCMRYFKIPDVWKNNLLFAPPVWKNNMFFDVKVWKSLENWMLKSLINPVVDHTTQLNPNYMW